MKYNLIPALALSMLIASCGNNETKTPSTPADAPKSMVEEAATTTTIALEGNDEMKYNANAFTVPVGQEITLNFKNVGKLSKETMGHNVVILKLSGDVAAYGNAAASAKAEDYMPKAEMEKVLAHTKLLGPGEADEIKFTITEPGEYPFLCSFPGHYSIMKGIITAK